MVKSQLADKKYVYIYIEGGSVGKANVNAFREGWKKFLVELHELSRHKDYGYEGIKVIQGSGRAKTFKLFKNHKEQSPNDLCVLLVDSETQVAENTKVWDVVANREGDQWQRPSWATERHLFLMVIMVETWLLTDQDTLREVFGAKLNLKHLPTTELENRSKKDIDYALEKATEHCGNGRHSYRHGMAHEIIGRVKPEKVKTLKHGKRLFEELGSLIRGE